MKQKHTIKKTEKKNSILDKNTVIILHARGLGQARLGNEAQRYLPCFHVEFSNAIISLMLLLSNPSKNTVI